MLAQWSGVAFVFQGILHSLNSIILYNWDDEYLHQFHIYEKDYGLSYAGGILFSDDARQVFLNVFDFDAGDKFTYEYNFFEHTCVDIRIEDIKDGSAQPSVYCMKGNGMPGANKYDEIALEFEIAIFNNFLYLFYGSLIIYGRNDC